VVFGIDHKTWNKGLTKEVDQRLMRTSEKMKGNQNGLGQVLWNACHTKDMDLRIMHQSEKMNNNQYALGHTQVPWNKGLTKEINSKLMEISRSNSESIKKLWLDPEFHNRMVGSIMKGWHLKPNKAEKRLSSILQSVAPDFKYVGDGSLVIGGLCPDFSNGDHKLIELFGDYWHKGEDPQKRIDYFKKFGYDTLVVWECELKEINDLISKIIEFMG